MWSTWLIEAQLEKAFENEVLFGWIVSWISFQNVEIIEIGVRSLKKAMGISVFTLEFESPYRTGALGPEVREIFRILIAAG